MIRKGKKLKIAIAMSGGVDSSVAAKLLKDQGHNVAGIFLHFWQEKNPSNPVRPSAHDEALYQGGSFENRCCSAQALLDARRVADKIGIPLYALNFARVFKKQVVDDFLSEYRQGKTPNPCVRCNKLVKLGWLIKQAKKLGFDYVATGHYVKNVKCQMSNVKTFYKLYKARDRNKDQSYFLYTLNQSELKHLLFPLGNYTKPQVRRLARKFKMPVAEKKDSQEICFIPGKSHNEFLKRHLRLKPGEIRLLTSPSPLLRKEGDNSPLIKPVCRIGECVGGVIGSHKGLPLYTVGQRKGIEIGGSGPYYAAKMDYKTNILYVVKDAMDPIIYSDRLAAKNINWLSGIEPAMPLSCEAVVRYRQKAVKCVVTKINKPSTFLKVLGENNFKVKFFRPLRAITSGQSVVFYRGGEALGGGIIK